MLVLSRKEGEVVFVGNDITIMVCEIRGNRVRLGITAPAGIPIVRKEIKDEQEQNKEASGS